MGAQSVRPGMQQNGLRLWRNGFVCAIDWGRLMGDPVLGDPVLGDPVLGMRL